MEKSKQKYSKYRQTQKTNLDSAQNQNSRPNTKTHSTGDSSSRRLNRGNQANPDSATENLSLDLSLIVFFWSPVLSRPVLLSVDLFFLFFMF